MLLNIKTSAERELMGVCPECKEHTTAGESCCGMGAYVEGGLITDEEAQDETNDPYVTVKVLINAPYTKCARLRAALFDAGVSSSFFGNGNATTDGSENDKWNVSMFVPVDQVVQNKKD